VVAEAAEIHIAITVVAEAEEPAVWFIIVLIQLVAAEILL